MIGGGGEKKTLRLVAQYADACNLFGAPRPRSRTSSTCCARHCDGRGPRLRPHRQDGARAAAAAGRRGRRSSRDVRDYAELGVTEVMVMPDRNPVEFATAVAEQVLPRAAEIG